MSTKKFAQKRVHLVLRMPKNLHACLKKQAMQNHRSLNSEMIWQLSAGHVPSSGPTVPESAEARS